MINVDPLSSSADEISDFSSDSELSNELENHAGGVFFIPLYIKNYLKTMETMPNKMMRDITKVKEIDSKMQKIFAEIDEIKGRMKSSKDISSHEMKDNLALVQRKLQRTLVLEEIKGTCLQSLHLLVDKSNSLLDEDSSRLAQPKLVEEEVPIQSPVYSNDEVVEEPPTVPVYLDESSLQEEPEGGDKSFSSKRLSTGTRGRGRRSQVKEQAKDEDSESAVTDSTPNNKLLNKAKKKGRKRRKASPDSILEPDPDEPRYCLCDQVSYGEMIGCDNENCPIEWFHFQCVDLSCKPKGKWFCPSCSAAKKKAQ